MQGFRTSMVVLLGWLAGSNAIADDLEVYFSGDGNCSCLLILDNDAIRAGISTVDQQAVAHGVDPTWLVNADSPTTEGANPPLRWNEMFAGDEVVLPTGRVGDEGFFSPPPPPTIRYADGSTSTLPYQDWINAYVAGTLTQAQLDKVRDVAPLRNADLSQLIGRKCVGVVYNSDVMINASSTDPLNANLQGARNGVFTFTILEVLEPGSIPESQSSDSLNDVRVRVEAPGSLGSAATDPANSSTAPSSSDGSGTSTAATIVPVLSVNADNRVYNASDLYIAMGEFGTTGWVGNVKRYQICDGGGGCTPGEILDADGMPAMDAAGDIQDTARSYWSSIADGAAVAAGGAGEQIPASADRRLVTYTGSEDVPATPVVLDPDSGEHAISTAIVATLAPKLQLSGAKLNVVRDEFTTVSYANNDGALSWSADWVETGDLGGGATEGLIHVSGGELRLQSDSGSNQIWREVDLSAASTATLSFDYDNQLADGPGHIRLEVSGDGGVTWRSLTEFSGASSRSGSSSFDISAEIAANTRIRFIYVALDADGRLAIDNVQIATDVTTLRDEFNTVSYSNNDGTVAWVDSWSEESDDAAPASGNVRIDASRLHMTRSGQSIWRSADLSGASAAILSFDLSGYGEGPLDTLAVEVSRDGGSTYVLLDSIDVVGAVSATRSYKVIGAVVSTDAGPTGTLRLRFRIAQGFNIAGQYVAVDNVQIQHDGGTQSATADTTTQNLVNWIRGQDVKDEDGDGDTSEDRPWAFASPQHSRPLVVTYGVGGTKGSPQPIQKMLLGTSDGGLRMINTATGVEEFVFYVPSMLDDQPDLFALADSASTLGMDLGHAYGVDGSPRAMVVDVDADGQIEPGDGDRVHVYVGLRRGGTEMYALDISPDDADGLTDETTVDGVTPKFMWRIRGGSGAFAALGQTWSAPQATYITMGTATAGVRAAHRVLIFGGGYDPSQDNGFGPATTGNAVFVVDPLNATKLLSIGGAGSGADLELPGMVYPIPGEITLMDSNGDAVTDRLYFADTGGQVWRVDLDPNLTAGNPGRTGGGRLAVLSDQSANAAPADQRRFYYPPEVTRISDMKRYAHVRDYDVITITSGYAAHPLDTSVHDRAYAIRDYLIDAPIFLDATTGLPTNYPQCAAGGTLTACGGSITEAELYDATENQIQDGDDTQIFAAELSLRNSEGWYIALKENFSIGSGFIGEKGLSKTLVLDGILFFTTFIPPQQSCGDDIGHSRLWAVELLTGEAVFAAFDGNPNQLVRNDRSRSLGSGLPGQPVPMFLPSGLRILVGSGDSMITFDPGIPTPIRKSYWYEER